MRGWHNLMDNYCQKKKKKDILRLGPQMLQHEEEEQTLKEITKQEETQEIAMPQKPCEENYLQSTESQNGSSAAHGSGEFRNEN